MKTKCEVEGCDTECSAKGLCRKHYKRFKRGGDPHVPSREELSLEGRFSLKLGPKNPVTGCIAWTARCTPKGHGQLWFDGTMIYAHRLAYELKHGPIPKGMCVCHRCDNPSCCNEEHLFLGTKGDNNADRAAKGRSGMQEGVNSSSAKLNPEKVASIRRLLVLGKSQYDIAANFGVSQATVSDIKRGKRW